MTLDWLIDWLNALASEQNHPLGLAAIAGSAMLEYVFPPFPGDTITLFGAALITGFGWNGVLVFIAIFAGSLGGALLDYWFGRKLAVRRTRADKIGKQNPALNRALAAFDRHGPAYLMLNRFLPGIRALFFVAAGMTNMPLRQVLLYGGISLALWTGLLIAVGAAIGANLEALKSFVHQVSTGGWIALAAAIILFVLLRFVRQRRARAADQPDHD